MEIDLLSFNNADKQCCITLESLNGKQQQIIAVLKLREEIERLAPIVEENDRKEFNPRVYQLPKFCYCIGSVSELLKKNLNQKQLEGIEILKTKANQKNRLKEAKEELSRLTRKL